MLIKLAVADQNIDYLERLSEVLGDYPEIRVLSYSEKDTLAKAIAKRQMDVLLLDPSMYSDSYELSAVSATVMLVGDGNIPYVCEDFQRINKYQRVSEIVRQMRTLCADKLKLNSGVSAGTASVAAFYSPVGGSGKTCAALIAVTKLAASGKRVCYINLESFPSDGCYLPQNAEDGIASILSRRGQKEEQVKLYISGIYQTKADKLHYFCHFTSPNDYAALEPDDIRWLIKIVRTSGCFDVVIIDTGSEFDDKVKTILESADRIVLLERADSISKTKLELLLSQLFVAEDYASKMVRVLNFYNGIESTLSTEIPLVGKLSALTGADSEAIILGKSASNEAAFALALEL